MRETLNRKVLIDADIFRYQVGAVNMKHPFLEDEFIPASIEYIHKLVDDLIKSTIRACGATDYVCVLSGKGNFRDDIAKQAVYKGNRNPNLTRPFHFKTVEDHIKVSHPYFETSGIEADDWLGTQQYEDWKSSVFDELTKTYGETNPSKLVTIIASRDKDLRTVQGWHYSWACGKKQPEKPLYYITPYDGMHMFMYQMLIGDNTDNIVGCGIRSEVKWGFVKDEGGNFLLDENEKKVPNLVLRRKGIGKSKAIKLLEEANTVRDMLDIVTKEYKELFPDNYEEIMIENARLLFIGQMVDKLFEWSWLDKYLDVKNPTNMTAPESLL